MSVKQKKVAKKNTVHTTTVIQRCEGHQLTYVFTHATGVRLEGFHISIRQNFCVYFSFRLVEFHRFFNIVKTLTSILLSKLYMDVDHNLHQ